MHSKKLCKLFSLSLLIVITLTRSAFASSDPTSTNKNLIIFGDSLVDSTTPIFTKDEPWPYPTNGNNYWVPAAVTGAPIVDVDTFYQTPVVNGADNVTGKAIWANYLARNYGKGYLYPSRVYTWIQQDGDKSVNLTDNNIDFAYASAETGDRYTNDLSPNPAFNPYDNNCKAPGKLSSTEACVPGIKLQVEDYLKLAKNVDKAHTNYVFWGGANDVSNNLGRIIATFGKIKGILYILQWRYKCYMNPQDGYVNVGAPWSTQVSVSCPVNNLVVDTKLLLENGVKSSQITVMGFPNLANTPKGAPNKIILDPISKLINARLVKQMSKQSIKVYPTTKLLDTIISSPASYGFDIVPSAGLTKYNCIDQVGNDAPLKKAACRSWVFVKTQHPTQHAGYCLFRSFDLWSDSTSVPTAPNVLKCNTPPK